MPFPRPSGGGGGAPTDATYLTGTADPVLTAEIVVGVTPGGELGGTWGSPTVDAVHSGSAHHAEVHAIDGADHTGVLVDAQIPASIARDTELHAEVHAIGGADHTGSITDAQHGARGPIVGAHGHDDLDTVTADQHHTEVHSAAEPGPHTFPGGTTTFLRGDGAFAVPPGGGGGASATIVEVDLGTPKGEGVFTITDAAIDPTSKLLIWQAPGPYTGKGTRADEAAMDPITALAAPAAGSAEVYWQTEKLTAPRLYTPSGAQDTSTVVPVTGVINRKGWMVPGRGAQRLGLVRGNVKFGYMVLT
jgi:hypothetical protein